MNQSTNIAQDAANETSALVEQETSWAEEYIGTGPFARFVKISGALIVFVVMVMLSKIVASVVRRRIIQHSVVEEKGAEQVADLIGDIVYYTLVIFSIFVGFQLLGFDVGLILGGVSFGVGLAFKEVLGNMIAGIMILSTKELKLGDIVEIDSTYFGRIEEITVRYTTIRTFDMRQVVLPNTTLITVPIKTYSAEEVVKLKTKVHVHYDTDLTKAIAVIVEAINSMDQVINKKKTKAYISQFADSAIELTAIFFVNPNNGEYYEVTIGEANHRIKDYFAANGVVIPYPHVTVTVDKADQNLLGTALFTAKNFIGPKTS